MKMTPEQIEKARFWGITHIHAKDYEEGDICLFCTLMNALDNVKELLLTENQQVDFFKATREIAMEKLNVSKKQLESVRAALLAVQVRRNCWCHYEVTTAGHGADCRKARAALEGEISK